MTATLALFCSLLAPPTPTPERDWDWLPPREVCERCWKISEAHLTYCRERTVQAGPLQEAYWAAITLRAENTSWWWYYATAAAQYNADRYDWCRWTLGEDRWWRQEWPLPVPDDVP